MENFLLIFIFIFVGLGMLFRRLKAFPDSSAQVLNMFALYVSLPALVLLKIPQLKLGADELAPLIFGLGLKLLVAPLLALLVCRLLGLSGLPVNVAIIEAGMPPMVVASALAVIAGMDGELAVALAGIGIVCSFVTLPLVFLLL